ncbi:hypothetical protein ACP70R_014574 [Stipagrostis hirtigluma subsp. patula]
MLKLEPQKEHSRLGPNQTSNVALHFPLHCNCQLYTAFKLKRSSQQQLKLLHMAGVLVSAIVQEVISRVSSIIFSKCIEKTSRDHNFERLEMANTELERAIERSSKLSITDVSLLRRRKILKRAFKECSDVLQRCKEQAQENEEVGQGLIQTNSSFPKRIAHATKSSIAYLFTPKKDLLCCSNVQRFEWFADCASKFVRDVESGCSIWHYIFSNPMLRQLLEGKTLMYESVQGSQLRNLYIWPICLEDRGVEAVLSYYYDDYEMPEKSFDLRMVLRLSESTDIVGIAIKCLKHLASPFKLALESAMGELTIPADVDDISHSYGAPLVWIQETHARLTEICRPNPLCCKAQDTISSESSNKFPEQVTSISFEYYVSELEYSLHSSTIEASQNNLIDWSPSLFLRAGFVPHCMWGGLAQNHVAKAFAGKGEQRDGNIEEEIEMVRSKTIDWLILRPELADYITLWQYGHGFAFFHVRTSKSELPCCPKFTGYRRSMTRRVAKRRR